MRFSQPKREETSLGISIAPLIDIVFLLLIFFMLTSHFETISGIDIRLPDISEKGRDRSDDNVVVVLDKAGTCYLQEEKVTLKDLYLRLQQMTQKKKISLILQADQDVRHGLVVRIMDLANNAGVNSIVIAAQWEPEKVY
ncbi:MAG TPA: biopolymer transporter ExbD [Desulfatiglandales bacterium]|nr:biopolymer transporter ExbD [Desulfatiglandales bacterium]